MKVTAKGSSQSPIMIDAQFLRKIGVVCEWIKERNIQLLANRYNITIEKLLGSKCEEFGEGAMSLRQAQARLPDIEQSSYSWELIDKRSYSVSTLELLIDGLPNTIGKIRSIDLSYGGWGQVRLNLTLSNETFASWYTVEGDEASVSHVHKAIQDIVFDAAVDYPILHRWLPTAVIRVGAGVASLLLYAWVITWLKPKITDYTYQVLLNFWSVPIIISAFGLSEPAVKYIKSAYPKVVFSFGNEARRAMARRNAVGLLATAIIIPVFLAYFGLT